MAWVNDCMHLLNEGQVAAAREREVQQRVRNDGRWEWQACAVCGRLSHGRLSDGRNASMGPGA
jgi:hypothetical protein